jgi:hypothetical protein
MDKLRNLNIADKITSGFKNFNSQKVNAFFTYLVVILIIIAGLVALYFYLLEKNILDIVYHGKGINLSSKKKKNIPASNLPNVTNGSYSINAWFAVDKSQYIKKKDTKYSHLISYGTVFNNRNNKLERAEKRRNERRKQGKYVSEHINLKDPISIGVWIENKTNDLLVVYRTDKDYGNTDYNPNNNSFNSSNVVVLKNYLLNEWNLISLVVDRNNVMVYLNGQLYVTKINEGNIYYKTTKPLFNLTIGKNKQIEGVIKNIRFRNSAYSSNEVNDLYFAGPKKFIIPDIREIKYLSDDDYDGTNNDDGSHKSKLFLDSGADLIDGALKGMNDFFKQF